MSESWDRVLHGEAGRKKLAAVRAVLADRFPDASDAALWLQTRQLLSTAESAGDMATRRADDLRAMRKLAGALKLAQAAFDGLSQPTREAFVHRARLDLIGLSFGDVAAVADGVASAVPETPFSSRENVAAIFLVDDARRIWAAHGGSEAPDAGLNEASPFAFFLADLFEALGVDAQPRPAFQAWQKYRASRIF